MIPMTYAEALVLFAANGRQEFSFLTAPYGVLKTVIADRDGSVAAILPQTHRAMRSRLEVTK